MSTVSVRATRLATRASIGSVEGALLLLALVALGLVLAPAHWSSLWMDREFTGGVAPLANRLVDGERLYTDGAHSPLPPLSFVLVRVLGGGDASWLTASVLNFLFQGLTLLVSWLVLRRVFGARVGFAATVCAIPIFLALPKTVLYDAMVQSCVALAALVIVTLPRRWPVLLGAVSAVAVLTKQSTGGALVGGVVLALLVAPPGGLRPLGRSWWTTVGSYLASLLAAAALLLAACAPWASPGGFVHDVLLIASDAKGDQADVLAKVRAWGDEVLSFGLALAIAIAVVTVAVRRFHVRRRIAGPPEASWWPCARPAHPGAGTTVALSVAAVAGAAIGMATWSLDATRLADPLITAAQEIDTAIARYRFTASFAAVLVFAIAVLWRHLRRADEDAARFVRVFCLFACAALGMSLSGPSLRWFYDNNPLVPFALGCLIVVLVWLATLLGAWRARGDTALAAVAVSVLSALLWASLGDQVWVARSASTSWPEIAHLQGAKLRPAAAGMRTLVDRVRTLAAPREPVLLLPEDPNVQAWFERPRPGLTSLMVFADQYWDRYVDEDFERLAADPPKVVVIGPRNEWRPFSHLVHRGRGAERLVDRVRRELLPGRYIAQAPLRITRHPVLYADERPDDWLDLWVRR